VNVTTQFIEDMRYLRGCYAWSDEDAVEIKAALQEGGEPLIRYFTVLASAHRAGYRQDAGNGFIRLQAWCAEQGLPDPFTKEFDPRALDALATEPRKRAA
jgi:hypothetical protein